MITFAVLGFSIELRRARYVVLAEARRRVETHMLRSRVRKRACMLVFQLTREILEIIRIVISSYGPGECHAKV
jgi:hypothetical protein